MSGTQVGSVEWRKFEYNIITIIEEIDVGDGGRWGRLDSCHYNIISDSYKFEPYAPGTEGWVSILWPPDKSTLLAVCDSSADADADVRMSGASAGGASVGAVASATAVLVGAAPPPTNTNSNSSSDANANANRTYFQALESNAVQDLLAQEQARFITITRQVEEDEELARQLAEQWNLADGDGDGDGDDDAGANQREGEGEDEDEDEDEDIAPLSPAVPPALSRANSGNGWVVLQPSPRGMSM